MSKYRPISFLPEERISPAIQNLGKTLSGIQAAKNQEMAGQIQAFQNLVELSMEGMVRRHQEEVMGESEKFKSKAAKMYADAFDSGRRLNYKEYIDLKTEKKNLLHKVNQSKYLKERYNQAMLEAARLERAGKLDPESKAALDKWINTKSTIEKTVDPMGLVDTKFDFLDFQKANDEYFKFARTKAEKETKVVGDKTVWAYTAEEVTRDAEVLWDGMPDKPKRAFERKSGPENTRQKYIDWAVNRYSGTGERKASRTNIYPPGYDKSWKSQYLLQDGMVTFKSGTSRNMLVGKALTTTDGDGIAAGTLFEPNHIKKKEDGSLVVTGVTTEKTDGSKLTITKDEKTGEISIDEDKTKLKRTEVEIPYEQIKTDMTIKYGRPIGEGRFSEEWTDYLDYDPTKTATIQKPLPKKMSKFTGKKYSIDGYGEFTAEELFNAGWDAVSFSAGVRDGKLKLVK